MTLEFNPYSTHKPRYLVDNTNAEILQAKIYERLTQLVNNASTLRSTITQRLLDPRRNLDKECGYPSASELTPQFYRDLYDREGIAARTVEVEPKETWKVSPEVIEDDDPEISTPFEKAWNELNKQLRQDTHHIDEESSPIWEYLERVDILSGIGSFGILLLGIDDGKQLQEPVDNAPPDGIPKSVNTEDDKTQGATPSTAYGLPIAAFPEAGGRLGTDAQYFNSYNSGMSPEPTGGKKKLLYLRAFDQSLVQIVQYEAATNNPRFGQPIMYLVTLNDPRDQATGVGLPLATVRVHWSRVIHVADSRRNSEVFGIPRMRPVVNRLLDLAKLYGGSAEGYWRGAFPGLSIETHPQLGGDVVIDQTAMRDMMDNYFNKLDRAIQLSGMSAKQLAPSVVDPTAHIDGEIKAICIHKGIPQRIFMGSERGELASSQDSDTWDERLQGRRKRYVTPRVIVPFIDRLILMGVLPAPNSSSSDDTEEMTEDPVEVATEEASETVDPVPSLQGEDKGVTKQEQKGYKVVWPRTDEESPDQKAKNALARTQAAAAYIQGGVESLIPPATFLEKELGYDSKEASDIMEQVTEHLEESYPDTEDNIMPGHLPSDPPPEPESSPFIKVKDGESLYDPNTQEIAHESPKPPATNEEVWEQLVNNGGPGSGPRPGHGRGKHKMYRGVGAGADTTSGFEWFSETPNLAGKYADFRGGKVEEKEIEIESPVDIGNPNAVQDAREFFAQVSKQADISKVDKTQVLEARKKFLDHFGDEKREVIDYWSNPKAKETTRELLESLKFDSITMKEGGENTVALLRSKPTANEDDSEDEFQL